MTAATKLWVNVVLQATQDALKDKRERAWFRLSNPDFIEVCSLADLDPEAVIDRAANAFRRSDGAETDGVMPGSKLKGRASKPAAKYQHDGKSLTIAEWSRLTGIKNSTIRTRLKVGCSIADALDVTRRKATLHSVNGVSKPLSEWASEHGLTYHALARRLKLGMPLHHALCRGDQRGRKAVLHTINGTSKTHAEWAAHIGISSDALHQRIHCGHTMAEAVALGGKHQGRKARRPKTSTPGVVSNLPIGSGTGGGSVAQERAEIEFSANPEKQSP
ncbi:MAG: hypothetical protein EOQ39_03605 [Mesorhizobium sp.]|uniref:hypothetical protein n=1 Tax=Mesorhizobium sp. TaxID=1871066 RepID=UPI000FE6AF76|nr:hypothetical protein [Mesorhizobium sp.]RWB08996.1 MAG: hypothetical protein EOQ37_05760 [Mesorhizobium sp.]RWB17417.1 MAG: hypothetical protein EOQ39_03605 [Mesorhizobium sp.]